MLAASSRAALLAVLSTSCLADNPPEQDDTGTESGTAETGTIVPETSIIGCPAGETCTLVFASQSFDDRVEVFAPSDPEHAYRGAIDLDLRTGNDNDQLDEPVGLALTEGFLHVALGHYPDRSRGTLLSIPRTMLGEYDAPETVPVGAILLAGAFQQPVVTAAFGVLEPIFMLDRPVEGRLLIGTFNNDVGEAEADWTQPGLLQVVDAADPSRFGTATLSGLEGGDCNGAAQIVMMDGTNAAIACDGNEAVAFLNLGDIGTGEPGTAAAAISGKVCTVSPLPGYRIRYLVYDGVDGVFVAYGPGGMVQTASGRVYSVRPANCIPQPVDIGMNGEAHLGQIVKVGDAFLVASGAAADETTKRGIFVVTTEGVCDEPIAGFEEHWTNPGTIPLQPFALAVSPDGTHLAVGAAINSVRAAVASTENVYGKVLYATLTGIEDPCTMSAEVVDLTDGAPGHALASDPVDRTTYRQQIYAVAVAEVAG